MNASKNEQNLGTATAAAASEPQDTITLLPPPKPIKAHLLDDAKRSDAARKAARALSERGFCVCRGGLDASIVSDARAEIAALFKHGAMTPGGFTRFGRDDLVKARRDDHTMWLHEYLNAVGGPEKGGCSTLTALDGCLASFGEAVMEAMSGIDKPNEPMGRIGPKEGGSSSGPIHYTGRTDLMLACYPGKGSAYGPHVDNADGDGREAYDYGRCVTMVCYLNASGWDAEVMGGSLRVHLPPPQDGEKVGNGPPSIVTTGWPPHAHSQRTPHEAIDVSPTGDTILLFRADKMLHEVRPSKAPRYAATVWLYGGSGEHRRRMKERGEL